MILCKLIKWQKTIPKICFLYQERGSYSYLLFQTIYTDFLQRSHIQYFELVLELNKIYIILSIVRLTYGKSVEQDRIFRRLFYLRCILHYLNFLLNRTLLVIFGQHHFVKRQNEKHGKDLS